MRTMKSWVRAWFVVLVVGACAPADDAALETTDLGSDEALTQLSAEPVPCDDPTRCLFDGTNEFEIDGSVRRVVVHLPDEPVGAPVIFAWHYLTGSPSEIVAGMGLLDLVDAGYIVIAPASRGLPLTEWTIDGDPDRNPDVALFDDLLDVVSSQYAVDQDRIFATGFSAGGLFTTYLTMHRGDRFAATAPYSGGSPSYAYVSPASDLPVLVAWGGRSDTYVGFSFADASEDFVSDLLDDGHPVFTCEHTLGHRLPLSTSDQLLGFFDDHGGEGARPWALDPSRVAEGCVVAQ